MLSAFRLLELKNLLGMDGTKATTKIDLLPEKIIKKIWKEVYRENVKKILEFQSYKHSLNSVIYFYWNNGLNMDYGEKKYVIIIPINNHLSEHTEYEFSNLLARVSKRGFKLFLKTCFREVENGNTCGIFNPKIINSGWQMYNIIGGSPLYHRRSPCLYERLYTHREREIIDCYDVRDRPLCHPSRYKRPVVGTRFLYDRQWGLIY